MGFRFDLEAVPGFRDTPTGRTYERANEIADERGLKDAMRALSQARRERLGPERVAELERMLREL